MIALWLSMSLAAASPCAAPPEGMRCVEGGARVVGEGAAKREVRLETWYLDEAPVTAAAFAACVADGGCPRPKGKLDEAGLALVDWGRAERYCAWAGKRLPTEAEWELGRPKGEALEWTGSNFTSPRECKAASAEIPSPSTATPWARALCGTVDRLDACDGAAHCGVLYRRVVKDPAKPTWRRGVNGFRDKRARAFRCATDGPFLTRYPTRATTTKRPRPPALQPPSAEARARFRAVREDDLDIPECEEPGRSYLDCRDPRSYLKTNEPLLHVVLPYVENRGGGYAGVGSDQSYTLVAAQRAEWAWLFDYDPNVVKWHHVLEALILAAPTPDDFLKFFNGKSFEPGKAAIAARVTDPREARALQRLYRGAAPPLAKHFRRERGRAWSWLGGEESYGYIRTLYQQGRMRAFGGNMLDVNAMRGIGDAARALKVPVRVYYPSNAPEFWELTPAYRANVRGLPFDDLSIVVQTISSKSLKTGYGQKGYWHYNVMDGRYQQRMLERLGITRHKQLLQQRTKSESPELTLTGIPSG